MGVSEVMKLSALTFLSFGMPDVYNLG